MRNQMSPERVRIGQELHAAETAIGVGRRTVRELNLSEPIDQDTIAWQQAQITEDRLTRNGLRYKLEELKQQESGPTSGWAVGYP